MGDAPHRPPLLVLMGFGASVEWQWHPNVQALARRHRLIVPDLVFFGGSHGRDAAPTLELQARTVLALMDRLGISRTDVLGLSYGGFVTFLLAAEAPARFGRLISVACPGPVVERRDLEDMCARFGVAQMADLLLPTRPAGVRALLEVAWVRPPPVPAALLAATLDVLFSHAVDEKRALLEDLVRRADAPPELPHLGPTLLLWGEHDRVFPVELAHRLAARIGPQARLEIIPDTAHAPQLEKPKAFNRLVLDFLSPPRRPTSANPRG